MKTIAIHKQIHVFLAITGAYAIPSQQTIKRSVNDGGVFNTHNKLTSISNDIDSTQFISSSPLDASQNSFHQQQNNYPISHAKNQQETKITATDSGSYDIQYNPYHQRRSIESSFSSASREKPTHRIVHIIIGVMGAFLAIIAGIFLFRMYQKRREKRDIENKTSGSKIPSNSTTHCQSSLPHPFHKFHSSPTNVHTKEEVADQFAHDFCHEERQKAITMVPRNEGPIHSSSTTIREEREELVSPSMQQHMLQYLILQQQHKQQQRQELSQYGHERPYSSAETSTYSIPNNIPPPPYQP
ncbi:hypothetical protein BDF14DRAFT_1796750 [Spinellus fusiger]|nr:hypothetical protein BDF14DRAFT_1796750 [Spinellus fusiger]